MKKFSAVLISIALPLTLAAQSADVAVTTIGTAFNGAGDVAVNADGEVFIGGFSSGVITKFDNDGNQSVFATAGTQGASGNEFDPQGRLVQSDFPGNKVVRYETDGTITTIANAGNGIQGPVGVAFDSAGDLFIANCQGNFLSKVDSSGTVTTFSSGPLYRCPNGLIFDDDDNLYVANFNDGNVLKVDQNGTASVFATITGNNNGHITFANDRLYVIGRGAHQVLELALDGTLTVLTGTGVTGNADGQGDTATHFLPNGIDHSPDGSVLWINDVLFPNVGGSITPNLLRRIQLREPFVMNPGLNGSWFNAATSGQGFFLDIFPDIPLVFLAWFTYDTTQDSSGNSAVVGDVNHRWLTAAGPFEGGSAELDVTVTTGGLFDDPTNVTNSAPGTQGTITVSFQNCTEGTIEYDLTASGLSGTIPITRIAGDNIPLCESLAAAAAK